MGQATPQPQGQLGEGSLAQPAKIGERKGALPRVEYVKPFKRRRPIYEPPVDFVLAGQPEAFEHTLINLLRDVDPSWDTKLGSVSV